MEVSSKLLLLAALVACACADVCNDTDTVFASAVVSDPTGVSNITANISFSSQANPNCTNITVRVSVSGLSATHGIHIHTGSNMSLPIHIQTGSNMSLPIHIHTGCNMSLPVGCNNIHIHTGSNMSLPGGCNNTGVHYDVFNQVNFRYIRFYKLPHNTQYKILVFCSSVDSILLHIYPLHIIKPSSIPCTFFYVCCGIDYISFYLIHFFVRHTAVGVLLFGTWVILAISMPLALLPV